IDLDDGLSGQAIATGGVVDGPPVDTAALAQLYPDATDWSTVPSTAWAVSIALIVADEPVGALTLWRYAEAPFAELDREALNLVAVQVSLALANAQLHDAVAELAIRDGLTGLHNRRYFDEVFGLVIAGRARVDPGERRPLAAILFDLDEFGQLNKRHGHQVGDEVLRVFGRILRQRFRSSDIVARYGGEEFIVILEGTTPDDVETLANDVRNALSAAEVHPAEGQPLPITVSAGCAMLADADETGEALLAMADVGLTLAKRGGRNRVVRV
ncbi:MAG TPA: sensor domain-containing diguanylate cyclase, partial [Candidatus Limnocylindrales bacterium]